MILVDQRKLVHVGAIVGVVRGDVEAVANAALRVDRAAGVARIHHGGDARDLGAEGQHLQVEHDLEVFVEGFRNAHRRLRQLQIGRDCCSAFWMRRSISRTSSRYSRQLGAIRRGQVASASDATWSITESSRLRLCCLRASRSALLLPSPNSFSKTTCGLFSIGSGVVGVFQEMVLE